MTKECVVCGAKFEAKLDKAKYCSKKCSNHSRYRKTREEIGRRTEIRDKEVVRLYGLGLNDVEIAKELNLSVSTIFDKRQKLGLPKQESKHQRKTKVRKSRVDDLHNEIRICRRCGKEYSPFRFNQKFCSPVCEKKHNHEINDIKRKRLERSKYVDDISLNDIYLKYKGICYICGGLCDYNAVRIVNGVRHPLGDYPSREHVIPLSKGGMHVWENVRLAHIRCNSSKGVRCG